MIEAGTGTVCTETKDTGTANQVTAPPDMYAEVNDTEIVGTDMASIVEVKPNAGTRT